MKKSRRSKSRKLRRRTGEKLASLFGETKPPSDAEPERKAPESGDASYAKPTSSAELSYNTKTAPEGTEFTDARDRSYRTGPGGQLQALNKPRSRVKRRREEKAETKRAETGSQRPAQSDN